MKLNLGCGFNKQEGCVNVDSSPLCKPDVLHDLEITPWPFEDSSVEAFYAHHTLEHLGGDPKVWMQIWKEIWRIAKPDAVLELTVPHPKHINFLIDPTHVRPILPETIAMFDQLRNIRDFEKGGQETKLGLMHGIDLEVVEAGFDLVDPWATGMRSGQVSTEQVQQDLLLLNNVCYQIRMKVRIIKPQRGLDWIHQQFASGLAKD